MSVPSTSKTTAPVTSRFLPAAVGVRRLGRGLPRCRRLAAALGLDGATQRLLQVDDLGRRLHLRRLEGLAARLRLDQLVQLLLVAVGEARGVELALLLLDDDP